MDTEGLTAWLATTMDLVGIVKLNEPPSRIFTRVHHELKRIGWLRFLDVLAFRLYYSLFLARRDARWIDGEIARLHSRYPAVPSGIQIIETTDANSDAVASFLRRLQPDLMLARCKCLLDSKIFNIPTHGTFVLHPGICPEYRNAHGCFWALANRDLTHVGMTMLQVDRGVDTGPVLLQASYSYDELKESHIVVQYRAVLENLEAITDKLFAVWSGSNNPISVRFRKSRTWGQPWLSAYLKWKRAARGARQ